MLNGLELSNEVAATPTRWPDPDELKVRVRDGLILIDQAAREQFLIDLEREMRRAGLSICSHLIPIGIPATSRCEMTPNEAGHLVRYLHITAPRLMPAIERVLSRYIAFSREEEPLAICPAA